MATLPSGDLTTLAETRYRTGVETIVSDEKTETRRNGLLHSIKDAPAVIHASGKREWYKDGLLHRTRGPAMVYDGDGYKLRQYWINGKRHNPNGPAMVFIHSGGDFRREWWINGKRHRADGPAVVLKQNHNGILLTAQEWCRRGKYHRIDGPAFKITVSTFDDPTFQPFERWYVNGKLHRLDGPAFISSSMMQYRQNAMLHRTDGPALINREGPSEWWKNGVKVEPFTSPTINTPEEYDAAFRAYFTANP